MIGGLRVSYAGPDHSVRRIGDRWFCDRRVCRPKNSSGTKLDDNELHDGLQFSGGVVPNHVSGSRYRADWRRDRNQQR
jgi:hypothetical protein